MRRISSALPDKATVTPSRPRRLLIFDLNVGYGGHGSIRAANAAFQAMGRATGAFETEVQRDPAVFRPESLSAFDGVFLNNTVGNLFEDPALRRSLVEFVYAGGGLMGVHGTSVAFTRWPGAHEDWPEFARMLGARGANHLAANEHAFITLDDPGHPLTAAFPPEGFERHDEFFRFHDPYSRRRSRVLLRIDTKKTPPPPDRKPFRADDDYAVAWVRRYGRGRVFYCSLAHDPAAFWDPSLLRFYLDATQFVLGDLTAPTTPSAMLTPATRAQETLGWRKTLDARTDSNVSIYEMADLAANLGLPFIGAFEGQPIRPGAPAVLDQALGDDAFEQLRLKLDDAGVTLDTYRVKKPPADDSGWTALFGLARKIGAESIVMESLPPDLAIASALCAQHNMRLAIIAGNPADVLTACKNLNERIGACADFAEWEHAGIDFSSAVRALGPRLISVGARGPAFRNVTSAGKILGALRDAGARPGTFAFDGSHDTASAKQAVATFDAACLNLQNLPRNAGGSR